MYPPQLHILRRMWQRTYINGFYIYKRNTCGVKMWHHQHSILVHFHPVYFPWSKVRRMLYPLLWTKVKGWFFIETTPQLTPTHTHNHSLAWKILVEIKNHPEIEVITEGRYTPYLASRLKSILHPEKIGLINIIDY